MRSYRSACLFVGRVTFPDDLRLRPDDLRLRPDDLRLRPDDLRLRPDDLRLRPDDPAPQTHFRAHETPDQLVCRHLLEKKKF